MLIDTHCHLTSSEFAGQTDAVLERAYDAGVERLLLVAVNVADAHACLQLARNYCCSTQRAEEPSPYPLPKKGGGSLGRPNIAVICGVHPHEAGRCGPDDLRVLQELCVAHAGAKESAEGPAEGKSAEQVGKGAGAAKEGAEGPRIVAIGETGLDLHYDFAPRDVQETVFRAHLALAIEVGLPVVIHARQSEDRVCEILGEYPALAGRVVFHCFSGDAALARRALDLGCYLSFTGVVTFKKADSIREAARFAPPDRMMIETDAPYLAPEPMRKVRPNEPALLAHTARFLAALRGEPLERFAEATTGNAVRFFSLEKGADMTLSLVTGGGGFIGGHIVRGLLGKGRRVRVLDDFSTGKRGNLAEVAADVEVLEGDIRDESAVKRAMQGVQHVYHLAARASVPRSVAEPRPSNDINITGTLNLLIAAKEAGVQRFVYSASSSAYGDTPVLPKHVDMRPMPLSPYAVSKLAAEHYCTVWAGVYGLPTISLRYFNVFGPRQDPSSAYAAVIPAFASCMLKGKRPVIYGDGEQSRDFCFVENVVSANLRAAEMPTLCGEVVNVACGERTTLNEIVRDINALLGTQIEAVYEPARAGDVRHSLADISETRRVLGYEPLVMFAEGLRRSIAWYRENLK